MKGKKFSQHTSNSFFETKMDFLIPIIPNNKLEIFSKIFRNEIIAALHNQPTSLPVILNPIHKMISRPGLGVAVSVGGTNGYASAFRTTQKGIITFINRKKFSIPKIIDKNKLFHLISENILSVIGKEKNFTIGIGLAYPLKPHLYQGFIDGELLYMTKGRNIKNLAGKRVGQEFHKFILKEYNLDNKVAVANDVICLLLGGENIEIAGIVGTGLNFAYWEKRANIAPLKLNHLPGFGQREVAVNIESQNFNKLPETKLRRTVDKYSSDPGKSLAEKEAAGAYLYQIFNAGKDKLLGTDFPKLTSTDQLNDIIRGAFRNENPNFKIQIPKARAFAERILHRSAQITAIELCGIMMKLGKTKGAVPVVMEGGIFWKAHNYHALVNLYVNMILPEVIPSFARLFGSSRRGIAILARGM